MSSKKQSIKKKTLPEKKSTAKKAAPAKKSAPVKKAAKAAPAAKKAVAQKAADRPVAKGSASKSPAKIAKSVKASDSKKTATKPAVKSAKISPVKSAKTIAKKPAVKDSKNKSGASKSAKVSAAKEKSAKVGPKSQKIVKAQAKTSAENKAKPVPAVSPKTPEKEPSKGKLNKPVQTQPIEDEIPAEAPVKKSGEKKPTDDSILLQMGGKLVKVAFFKDDDEQEDRAATKKVSADAVEKPTASMRRRASLAEETPEELYARVIAELQEENLRLTQECLGQLCTKCCRNPVAPEFRVDKDLGYCEECAEILGLGHSKEARHLNYQAKLLGTDSLDEARDDDFGEAPSQQEIEEADEELLDDESDI